MAARKKNPALVARDRRIRDLSDLIDIRIGRVEGAFDALAEDVNRLRAEVAALLEEEK